MAARAWLVASLTACGRFGFDDRPGGDGGAGNGDTGGGIPATIQRGVTQLPMGMTAATATINSVDLQHAFVVFNVAGASLDPSDGLVGATLNSSNIQFSRIGTAVALSISWQVIELPQHIDVQRGNALMPGPGIPMQDIPISSVEQGRSFVLSHVRNGGVGYDEDDYAQVRLITPTQLHFECGQPGGGGRLPAEVSYEVITLRDGAGSVVSGVNTLGVGSLMAMTAMPGLDPTHGFAVASFLTNADDGDVGSLSIKVGLDSGELFLYRDVSALDAVAAYSVVSSPYFTVEQGLTPFAVGESSKQVSIAVDPARAFVLIRGATTTFVGTEPNDRVGIAWFRGDLGATTLTLTRGDALDAAQVAWSIVRL